MTALLLRFILATTLLTVSMLSASAEKLRVEILEPYAELHTGPGQSYPIFYVIQRGEEVEIQKRRAEWYQVILQVNTNHSKTGWIHRDQILDAVVSNDTTIDPDKRLAARDHPRMRSVVDPRAYLGFNYGQSSSTDLAGVYGGYFITPRMAVEFQWNEHLGEVFQSQSWSGDILFAPFDQWKISPFFQVGAGSIDAEARGTNSSQNDSSDKFIQTGGGIYVLLGKYYKLRFEYRHMNILQSRDDNRELETWHIGFIGYL